nr:hypothetical protein CFP56_52340 [Quercus suber]
MGMIFLRNKTGYATWPTVLELQDNGNLSTSDDPPVVFGCVDRAFIEQLEKADLHYLRNSNLARAFADSYSKAMFHCIPL